MRYEPIVSMLTHMSMQPAMYISEFTTTAIIVNVIQHLSHKKYKGSFVEEVRGVMN